MVTRLMRRNKVIWANAHALPRPAPAPDYDKIVVPPDEAEPVEIRAGDVLFDVDDDLHYRVINRTPTENGWAVAEFWLKRYEIAFSTLLQMAKRGLFDAAMEHGSPTKRYRVRSEDKAKVWIKAWKQSRNKRTKEI